MTKLALGRLERLELRNTWQGESNDFTPWLAQPENIRLVADVLGIDLEVVGTEPEMMIPPGAHGYAYHILHTYWNPE